MPRARNRSPEMIVEPKATPAHSHITNNPPITTSNITPAPGIPGAPIPAETPKTFKPIPVIEPEPLSTPIEKGVENANVERKVAKDNIKKHLGVDSLRASAKASGGDSNVESGKVEQPKKKAIRYQPPKRTSR